MTLMSKCPLFSYPAACMPRMADKLQLVQSVKNLAAWPASSLLKRVPLLACPAVWATFPGKTLLD